MTKELTWLRRVHEISRRLAEEHDRSKLLPLILDAAVELTEAERGFLVLVSTNQTTGKTRLKVEEARGFDKMRILAGSNKVSRTVVTRVLEQERGVVTTSEEDSDLQDVTSIKERRVLSIASVPLRARSQTLGVLYLDHRFDKNAFSEEDLPILASFADQAALALETADLLANRESQQTQLGVAERELEALRVQRASRDRAKGQPLPSGDVPRFGGLIGSSDAIYSLYEEIARAARTGAPVLVQGPSGSGKVLVAREIHGRSYRAKDPLLTASCNNLTESDLFGHVRGAFADADEDRDGLFVQAGSGTLVLDEVGDMSPGLQTGLLRVLQEGKLRPVGSSETVSIGCRIIATTQHDLSARVAEDLFRQDLYYRLDVLRLNVPPLTERATDIPALLGTFLAEANRADLTVSPEALEALMAYPWPGNVRELKNEAQRLSTLDGAEVTTQHLSPEIRAGKARPGDTTFSGKTLGEVEREMIAQALRDANGNKAQAARLLGVPRSTLYDLVKRHKL